jgi:hypothetical protein
MQKADVIKQIDATLSNWSRLQYDVHSANPYHQNPDNRCIEVITAIAETIRRFSPPGSEYLRRLNAIRGIMPVNDGMAVHLDLAGTVRSLRDAYQNDYLATIIELVHADTFSDLLDQAAYLLEQRYKDAAAVIVGGVLEEHVRKLCGKHGIPINDSNSKPLKATYLNDQLKAANAYGNLEHKNVASWQDLRNKAAHGRYQDYDSGHVELFLMGVRHFVATHPA